MVANIITSFFFGVFILTVMHSFIDVAYNVKNEKKTEPAAWVIPSIFAAVFWFCSHL
jgi:hypothetical protein